jgi:urease accessory protein
MYCFNRAGVVPARKQPARSTARRRKAIGSATMRAIPQRLPAYMNTRRLSAFALLTTLSLPALAHPGHGATFTDGMLHPLSGADHLLAMLGVGAWAALQAGRARWLVPASFLLLMALGAWLGLHGHAPLATELGVAASVAAVGLLILRSVRPGPVLAMLLAGAFALFHGFAHGIEMAMSGALHFGAGFLLASATLLLTGYALGSAAGGNARLASFGGAAIAACGAFLVLQTL